MTAATTTAQSLRIGDVVNGSAVKSLRTVGVLIRVVFENGSKAQYPMNESISIDRGSEAQSKKVAEEKSGVEPVAAESTDAPESDVESPTTDD